MAGIPRFQAQIKTVSIPRMQDYEYEQNRSIYQTLKAAGERIDNTFFEMVAEGRLGEPNSRENPDYKAAVKEHDKAISTGNQKYIEETRQKVEQTPNRIFNWWG